MSEEASRGALVFASVEALLDGAGTFAAGDVVVGEVALCEVASPDDLAGGADDVAGA